VSIFIAVQHKPAHVFSLHDGAIRPDDRRGEDGKGAQGMASDDSKTIARSIEVASEVASTTLLAAQTLRAAGRTIALRMVRLAADAARPEAWNDPEYSAMIVEKGATALEAQIAMAEGAFRMGESWMEWGAQHYAAWQRFALACCAASSPADQAQAVQTFAHESLSAAENACSALGLEAARLGGRGLAPFHRVASDNARRLTLVASSSPESGRNGSQRPARKKG
jgi:hypothetical protein